jgi:hypothetical protein
VQIAEQGNRKTGWLLLLLCRYLYVLFPLSGGDQSVELLPLVPAQNVAVTHFGAVTHASALRLQLAGSSNAAAAGKRCGMWLCTSRRAAERRTSQRLSFLVALPAILHMEINSIHGAAGGVRHYRHLASGTGNLSFLAVITV